ncbi:MAG: hypothetical protein B6D63_06115 [Candidatus Latescibacteria bacterium 4484_7]|nr:MAG: hypothetical protein B6D63_06115 [Candidatus Latescibacteria bacterium 4484_7]
MRFSSSSTISSVLVAIAALVFSCSHRIETEDIGQGDVSLCGRLGFAGETPFERRIILSDADGVIWTLENGSLEGELLSLAGFDATVRGRLLGQTEQGPRIFVERYEVVPPEGEEFLIGTLKEANDGILCIDERDRGAFVLEGGLVPALSEFVGQKVWVIGRRVSVVKDKMEKLEMPESRSKKPVNGSSPDSIGGSCSIEEAWGVFRVRGYGVLGL